MGLLSSKRAVHDGALMKLSSDGRPRRGSMGDTVEKKGLEDLDGSASTKEEGQTRRRSSTNERLE